MIKAIDSYKIYADYYDLVIEKMDYSDIDIVFYKAYCQKNEKIIEVGCGTGRILEDLLKSGFQNLTGVDISPEMLDKAQEKLKKWMDSKSLALIEHDFTDTFLPDKFDRALVTFYTFNYILDRPVEFLKNICQSLHAGGWILMDVFYPRPLYAPSIYSKPLQREYVIDGNLIKTIDRRRMIGDFEERRLLLRFKDEEVAIDTYRRYYPWSKLKNYLELAGFKDIKFSIGTNLNGFKDTIEESELERNYIVKARK